MTDAAPAAPLDRYAQPPTPTPQGSASAVLAGFLGWTFDAFDFFLVVICAPHIRKEFGVTKTELGISLLLALVFRPVGALIFGLLADRYGRRTPLIINLVFYSLVEIFTGLAPNFATFLVLRALFGIGMGGEWGVGASLAMEKVSPRWRGVLSGLLQEGYAMGFLLASAAYGLFSIFGIFDKFPVGSYPISGWRMMFFLGGLPALLSLYVRFGVKESEVWERTHSADWRSLRRNIFSNWKVFLYLVLLMAAMNFSSHGTQDFYPTMLEGDFGFTKTRVSWVLVTMQVGAICGGILFGLLSDHIGRRNSMAIAFFLAIAVIPLWAFPPNLTWLVAGAFLIQFMVQGAWGIIPAHINELSPDQVRGFLPGFSYQCGNLIAASIGWLQGTWAVKHDYPHVMAISAAIIFVIAIVVTAIGREKRGVVFGQVERTD